MHKEIEHVANCQTMVLILFIFRNYSQSTEHFHGLTGLRMKKTTAPVDLQKFVAFCT